MSVLPGLLFTAPLSSDSGTRMVQDESDEEERASQVARWGVHFCRCQHRARLGPAGRLWALETLLPEAGVSHTAAWQCAPCLSNGGVRDPSTHGAHQQARPSPSLFHARNTS